MSNTLIFEFEVKREAGEQVVRMLRTALPETRAYDGCISTAVFREEGDPNRWTLVEEWESKAKLEKYSQWRVETGFTAKMMDLVVGPPKLTWVTPFKV